MLDHAMTLLDAMGVKAENDDPILQVCLLSVRERILNATNQTEPPEGACVLGGEMIAAQYLRAMKSVGRLDIDGLDLSAAAVTQIKEGDTTVQFSDSSTAEARLDTLITAWSSDRTDELKRFRRLEW